MEKKIIALSMCLASLLTLGACGCRSNNAENAEPVPPSPGVTDNSDYTADGNGTVADSGNHNDNAAGTGGMNGDMNGSGTVNNDGTANGQGNTAAPDVDGDGVPDSGTDLGPDASGNGTTGNVGDDVRDTVDDIGDDVRNTVDDLVDSARSARGMR